MNPSYLKRETPQRDRWMVSYMDVLTLLMIFFVTIAAQSRLRTPQHTVAPTPPPPTPAPVRAAVPEPPSPLLQAQQKLEHHGLDLRMEARGLVVSIPQAILFSSGKDKVTPQALPILGQIADVLRDLPNQVTLIGHADAVPIHNRHFQSNWDLAAARGLRILDVLSHRYGIPESRLSVASYGPYRPSSPNDTALGRAHNRRVEIVISAESQSDTKALALK